VLRTLAEGGWPAGNHTVEWDGRDDRGLAVAPGTYLVRIRESGKGEARSLTILR
jgi:flagellar hook assembly protein FlgD